MRTYLVTGGAGFIGSNYIHYMFKKYGDTIRIYPGSTAGNYWEFSNTGIRWKDSGGGTISTVVTQ